MVRSHQPLIRRLAEGLEVNELRRGEGGLHGLAASQPAVAEDLERADEIGPHLLATFLDPRDSFIREEWTPEDHGRKEGGVPRWFAVAVTCRALRLLDELRRVQEVDPGLGR